LDGSAKILTIQDSLFLISYKAFEKLKENIGDAKVQVKVSYFDEPFDNSGAVGTVLKISLKDEILYENK
jgi:hypothetical protein